MDADRNDSGDSSAQLAAAWDDFTRALNQLGHDALAAAPNEAERVDGLRFILRQLAYREEQFVEFPGTSSPEFFWPESPTRKVFADCPDTIYRQVNVARGATYRLTGTRGASPYISFTAYRAGVADRVVADLHDGEIEIADDGTFELVLGGPPVASNWLNLGTDAAFVVVREYTHDRVNGVKATFEIEQLDPTPGHRAEQDTASMAGTPHNHYQLCYVQLESGQALEVELDPPECRYWSIHLNNFWLESPEFRDGQSVCINDAQAERSADGIVRVLVGPDDPGTANWLDTKGRSEAILLARYLLPENELPPITARLISI